jgi:hypothetical protein
MEIDTRGPRFAAFITTLVLAVVLVTDSVWLLAAQAVVFAAGSIFGLRHPYRTRIFAHTVTVERLRSATT